MSITDAIVATFAGTLFLAVVVFYVIKSVRRVWVVLTSLTNALIALLAVVRGIRDVADQVRGELAWMRQVTQQQVPEAVEQAAEPPVGRRSQMPPAFPTRDYYDGPPARPEDTDVSLLHETEEEVMQAQEREELRARGIEPDTDDVPQEAVREDV